MRYLSLCSAGRPAIDMTGKTFGRLVVVERVPNPKRKDQARWRCRCVCGGEVTVPGARLRGGSTKSCGCLHRDRIGAKYRTHGKSTTPAYCMFYDARKRAVALGLPFSIQPDDIEIPERCPVLGVALICGGRRENAPSLDRVIPSLGYVPSNIRVVSFRANRIKSNATVDELRAILKYVEGACAT